MSKQKTTETKKKKTEQTLYIGGERISVGSGTITSTPSPSSEDEVKKGLESIQKRSIFPTPVTTSG